MRYEPKLPWPARYERNTRIVEALASGLELTEIAKRFRLAHAVVVQILRTAGIPLATWHERGRKIVDDAKVDRRRDQAILKARGRGESYSQIGERYQVSKQRIEQIVRRIESAPSGSTER